MKIFTVIEHKPATGRIKRGRFEAMLRARNFANLPGVSCGWVADHQYATVGEAREAIIEASAASNVAIQKAYVIEYGNFALVP
ncbi:hypothetical protein [Luteolibacter soli]|uniref:DUF4242 domain-containing protein n=1 Tax=Luteolibacter soli TaxID=3135280 RepID=A0ABU9AYN5_9BACT